jgi:carboxylate-amine ligase
VAGTREILKRKTSADRQVEVFNKAQRSGASRQEALRQVVEFLIDETARGVT